LSDERTEYLINDRLSFMRFMGLGLSDCVPDAKTIWLFRERLTQTGAIDGLFNGFDTILRNAGYLPMSGQIQSNITPTLRKRSGRTMEPRHPAISPSRSLATNPTSPSTGSSGSSGNGRRRMPPPVMVRD
jgi:hypothetical protein